MSKARRCFCCLAVCLLSLLFCPFCGLSAEAYEKERVEIPVICLDVEELDEHIYNISIETEDPFAPVPLSDTLSISKNGTGYFEIEIDEPGTFVYNVYEQKGDEPDIEYEERAYTITLYVETNENDELLCAVSATINGTDVKSDEISFQDAVMEGSERKKPRTTETTELTTTSSSALTTTSATATTTATAVTTIVTTKKTNTIIENFEEILTGDSFPAKALCCIIAAALLVMVGTLVLKKKKDSD